ncbi:MAG: type II toxin-antitoxin system VapC family toxin [Acidobacteriota bacterium]|nr:type II toxin-antitoxin system VapC family toxin [Acidobacteriota bacterium]MDE3108212.1 type II toxin-antitoxin system VapC family toxin [Acidobacteriota bacterium]MDE3223030.1 type II toxin-antitoxin system VapC family toxin [Acidobacteriota bacterium]
MVWYLDTSAFLKLLTQENETQAMRAWFHSHEMIWSSHLLATEARRAGARLGLSTEVIDVALESVALVLPSVATFYVAGQLLPTSLRSLDALHLATAVEIGVDLDGVVTYDERLADAARAASLVVVTPR